MALEYLDHVNIRTAQLAEMEAFYRDVLGLRPGPRPPFSVGGRWLYCGERAAIHLVEVPRTPETGEPRLEHFAFRANGLAEFTRELDRFVIPYEVSVVPEWEIRQVNLRDPDGNHIEIAFGPEEPWAGDRG
jgi:catechol 2,3-dioxygenase-like lactoylglutathione lyase family enzyme